MTNTTECSYQLLRQHKDILEVRRPESMLFAVHGVHPAFYGTVLAAAFVLSVRSEKDWSSY